ncbi:hypothetical protein GPROT2_03074 [Gammaproteobacteria bacterium]|nr:PEP-CTERM sorting domain-containing protein [Gammaproteobacteria bacterium]QOJ32665.1 MAG: PEP-CTERM sorting domain-containing protein [Gammaproteobacteria bacterium]CAG0945185.1 hypothetical protein GPROT2_03074 [Gammaproteobacteria bacterium]
MNNLARVLAILLPMLAFAPAPAAIYNGVEFPQGAASFADQVVNFSPGAGPAPAFLDANNALGVPDVNTTNGLACFSAPSTSNCKFTSLGNAGVLTLRFTDNVLSGSSASGSAIGVGDGFNDLYLVEVGVSEATTLDISADGNTWFNVGSISGGAGGSIGVFTYGFDIDKFGFGTTDLFSYVRITDLVTGDPETSPEGADIDAVGAIQTAVVPVPAGIWLLPAMAVVLRRARRRPSSTAQSA